MRNVRPIRNEADYEWACGQVARYFQSQPAKGSQAGNRFEVLLTLISAYEDRVHPVPDTSPNEVLRFAIESMGRTQKELADILGSSSRASEILSGKRKLTTDMIANIAARWRLPVAALISTAPSGKRAA